MAFSNSKPLLLQTQNPVSPLLMIFIFFLLLLNNVRSQSYASPSPPPSPSPSPSPSPRRPPPPSPLSNSETVGFGFSSFGPQPQFSVIALRGDASVAGGALQLTKKDNLGNPIQNSVGRAQYFVPVHLWDRTTGKLADFSSSFTFVVNPKGSSLYGDGLAFFLAPIHSTIPINSNGGYLGLFSPKTALNSSNNQIVAIEFDSYTNQWDPVLVPENNHIGIDINSIRSVLTAPWPRSGEPDDAIAFASINYNGESKTLSVYVSSKSTPNRSTSISHVIDLRTVLPEWVKVGFSAATGQLVATHDILSWSFEAAL